MEKMRCTGQLIFIQDDGGIYVFDYLFGVMVIGGQCIIIVPLMAHQPEQHFGYMGKNTMNDVYYWIGKLSIPKSLQWKMKTNLTKSKLEDRDYIEVGKCKLKNRK